MSAVGSFRLGRDSLTPARLAELVDDGEARLALEPEVAARLDAGARALEEAMARAAAGGPPVYGATTGFGGNAGAGAVGLEELQGHQLRLARYLDAGSGPPLPYRAARGALVARAHVLARGASGVRSEVVERMAALVHANLAPIVPRDGSLGASGDLVSLAPLALLLAGEPVACLTARGDQVPGPEALREAGIPPLELRGRDTLALVNGLSGVAALVALHLVESRLLLEAAVQGAAAAGWALGARTEAWSEAVNRSPLRLHLGQARVADSLRRALEGVDPVPAHPAQPQGAPLQDPYSLRCIPQLLGPGLELLEVATGWLEAELDGVSDNPVPDGAEYRSGGNFFGGYVAAAADAASGVLARVGDLLERQSFLLVGGARGLPANLVPPRMPPLRHGLKGVHQAMSALAMGLQRGALPSAPLARSAEGHNQDVVSNAMNAGTALAEQVDRAAALVAAHTAMAAQAVELRGEDGASIGAAMEAWLAGVRGHVPRVDDDQSLREPLAALARALRRAPLS